MDELEETRRLLREVTELLKLEKEAHIKDVNEIWSFCAKMLQHHDSMSSDVHLLLKESEERMGTTNRMVHDLSDNCRKLVEINRALRDSYVTQFESSQKQNEHLLEENARLMKENEAYYLALKNERERNDKIMSSMVSFLCGGSRQPLVNIDQKTNDKNGG